MLPKSVLRFIEKEGMESIREVVSEEEEKSQMREQGCNEAYIEKVFTSAEKKLEFLGVAQGSTFFEFYTSVWFVPMGQGEELHDLDGIVEEKESLFHDDEFPGIYDRFLQISSIEGEGSYFYEVATDIVYDTDWGEEQAMMQGTLEKKWSSFYVFLEWYYSNSNENS